MDRSLLVRISRRCWKNVLIQSQSDGIHVINGRNTLLRLSSSTSANHQQRGQRGKYGHGGEGHSSKIGWILGGTGLAGFSWALSNNRFSATEVSAESEHLESAGERVQGLPEYKMEEVSKHDSVQ